ncbi:MAG: hypothetical protein Q8N30_03530 [Methylococcales bacterium]|nr:hypothetical protein [Methylococcales bacterium]
MGKNRTWHNQWEVDLANNTVTHSSGLIVKIEYSDNANYVLETPNVEEWNKLQSLKMNLDDLIRHTQKLCNESKKAYDYAIKKKER